MMKNTCTVSKQVTGTDYNLPVFTNVKVGNIYLNINFSFFYHDLLNTYERNVFSQ